MNEKMSLCIFALGSCTVHTVTKDNLMYSFLVTICKYNNKFLSRVYLFKRPGPILPNDILI